MDTEAICERLRLDIQYRRDSLAGCCTALADNLTRLSQKLGGDMPVEKLHINDLGEIQGAEPMIDAECGRLTAKISVLELMEKPS